MDMKLLSDMGNGLEPFEIVVKELSERAINLLAAETSINFTFKHLRSLGSELCARTVTSLEARLDGGMRII